MKTCKHFLMILLFYSCTNHQDILNKKFSIEDIQSDVKELIKAYDEGKITGEEYVGLSCALMNYQPWYAYRMEEKTYQEIIDDIPMFRSQNGIIEGIYDFEQLIDFTILNSRTEKEDSTTSVFIILKNDNNFHVELDKLILTVHDPVGTEKVIFQYEQGINIPSNTNQLLTLKFKTKTYTKEIGNYSKLGGKITLKDKHILKYTSYKVFGKGRKTPTINESESKMTTVLYPDCSFSYIIEEQEGTNLNGTQSEILNMSCK